MNTFLQQLSPYIETIIQINNQQYCKIVFKDGKEIGFTLKEEILRKLYLIYTNKDIYKIFNKIITYKDIVLEDLDVLYLILDCKQNNIINELSTLLNLCCYVEVVSPQQIKLVFNNVEIKIYDYQNVIDVIPLIPALRKLMFVDKLSK